MGNLFKGQKKAAQQAAAASVESARLQAEADTKAAEQNRIAAETQAQATRDASAASQAAALRQEALIRENGKAANDAALRQEGLLKESSLKAEQAQARQEQSMRDQASGIQRQKEMDIARDLATKKASEVLEEKPANVDVTLASDIRDQAEIDPATGRRRPVRAAFMSNRSNSSSITI